MSCGFIDFTLAFLLKIYLRFRGSFLRFHNTAGGLPHYGPQMIKLIFVCTDTYWYCVELHCAWKSAVKAEKEEETRRERQGRSDGGYIGIYTPLPKSVYLTNFYVVTGCFSISYQCAP